MDYLKHVIVLKQVCEGFSVLDKSVSAIARVENDGGVPIFSLSVINIKRVESGEYVVFIMDEKHKMVWFQVGVRPISLTKTLDGDLFFNSGFACGIAYLKDNIPNLIAFSRSENFNISLSQFKKSIAYELMKRKTLEEKERAEKLEQNVKTPETEDTITSLYDDEAVATENYFELDEEIDQKLCSIKEKWSGNLSYEDGTAFTCCEEEKAQVKENDYCEQFKARDDLRQKFSKDNPFYLHQKKELDKLFERFPRDATLKRHFPTSKWVRVTYAHDKYYVVGIIKENNVERYICYGVPAKYSTHPPKEFEGVCSFIPISLFDMQGEGFWMMFQDAFTGECVKRLD